MMSSQSSASLWHNEMSSASKQAGKQAAEASIVQVLEMIMIMELPFIGQMVAKFNCMLSAWCCILTSMAIKLPRKVGLKFGPKAIDTVSDPDETPT